jgi:lipoate-protein ligase A
VVHYPGNLNVSVALADGRWGSAERTFGWFGDAIASGLRRLGAASEAGDRRVAVAGRKLSGAAQARRGDAVLVHGTLLVRPDAVDMALLLRAMQKGYAPLGTRSHPCAVTTLSDVVCRPVALAEAADAVVQGLAEALHQPWESETLTPMEEALAAELEKTRYRSRAWNESR